MKLLTFINQDQLRLGAVLDSDQVIDLPLAYVALQESKNLPAGNFPTDMLALLQGGDEMLNAAAAALKWIQSADSGTAKEAFIHPVSQIKIAPLMTNPTKIICIGLNYYDHCRETGTEVPKSPITFVKYPSAIIGPEENITWSPEASSQVDYEAELAFVIKRTAKNVPANEAFDYIAGYTMLNDISARDVQFSEGQWVRSKSFDTFCPIGPYLVTSDEVGDPHQLAIKCRLNGELVQDSNTSELIFKIPFLMEFITKTCTLLPGDIVSTGTPHGVGVFRDPPIFLKPGDVIEVEIDKLGRLRNPIA